MRIPAINSINFKNLQFNASTNKKRNKSDKTRNLIAPIALGLTAANTALLFVKTDPTRIAKIVQKKPVKPYINLRSGAIEIEVVNFKDNPKIKSLDELSGLEKIKEFFNEYQIITQHPGIKKEHNIHDYSSLLFWGVPGTGKTSAAKGIAKKLDADYIQIDKELFDSMLISEGPQRLAEVFEQIEMHAKNNPKMPVVVFMDEIDGTISIDRGLSARHSEDLTNGLKKGMVHLQEECDNVIFIGATNKDPNGFKSDNTTVRLNPAILSRFKYQIEIALPHKEAIYDAWSKLMKTDSGKYKFTELENEIIAQHFYDLNLSYRDLEVVADKLNRLDAVQECQIGHYNSKKNLIKAMLNDEKIGYDPVLMKSLDRNVLEEVANNLRIALN